MRLVAAILLALSLCPAAFAETGTLMLLWLLLANQLSAGHLLLGALRGELAHLGETIVSRNIDTARAAFARDERGRAWRATCAAGVATILAWGLASRRVAPKAHHSPTPCPPCPP